MQRTKDGEKKRQSASAKKMRMAVPRDGGGSCRAGGERGRWCRKEVKNTHKDVGKKEGPLEPVPTKAGRGTPTLLAEKASLDAVVVLVALSRHTSLTAAKSLTSSARFRTEVKTFAAILEAIVKDSV